MRKMKKINGYLVVKFNARELREYEGTALGEYGVIDAELYTGILDVDRGAMEYDNAGSMEEAVELARGLESELDAEEPEVKVTIVKETDETTEEEEVDAQQMIAGWETVLRGQVASAHYKDVDERTAAHELYGYKAALRDLGLLDREDCYVPPDTFGEERPRREKRATFENLHPELKRHRETAQVYALGLALAEDCPDNDCRLYLNIFNTARELDTALDDLDVDGAPALYLRQALRVKVGELVELYRTNYAVELYRKEAAKKERPPAERTAPEEGEDPDLAKHVKMQEMMMRTARTMLSSLTPRAPSSSAPPPLDTRDARL